MEMAQERVYDPAFISLVDFQENILGNSFGKTVLGKLVTGLAMAGLMSLAATSALAQEEKVLNIYNWSDYIAEDTIQNFEKETGIKVRYAVSYTHLRSPRDRQKSRMPSSA